jgi:hypothetical protein
MKKLQSVSMMIVGLVAVVALATRAQAACGDDVDGRRVACRCGDVVVSDTVLQASDPVVSQRCAGDGLLVRARPGAASLTLDLAGMTIVGMGRGTGIRVIDGGTAGATITGGATASAEVAGFGTGFRARGQRSVRELHNVSFTANARDGVVLRGAATDVLGVAAERNGRDGMRVGGRGPRLDGVEAQQNARYGLRVTARGAQLGDAVSAGNDKAQMRANKGPASRAERAR